MSAARALLRSPALVPGAESLGPPRCALLRFAVRGGVPVQCKDDRGTVLAAVKQDAWAIDLAAEDLKADPEIQLAAAKGGALQFASADLRADKEVVLAAVKQNGFALRWASEDLQADEDVRRAAGHTT